MKIAGNPLIWHLNVETEFTWESLCAKLLESCLTLHNPMDCNSPGSFVYGDSPGKNTGVGCHGDLLDTGIKPISPEVTHSCPTLCDPVDCSLPGSSIQGILQARILEWIAISFSRGSSRPRDRTQVSHIAGRRFTI